MDEHESYVDMQTPCICRARLCPHFKAMKSRPVSVLLRHNCECNVSLEKA